MKLMAGKMADSLQLGPTVEVLTVLRVDEKPLLETHQAIGLSYLSIQSCIKIIYGLGFGKNQMFVKVIDTLAVLHYFRKSSRSTFHKNL